MTINGTLDQGGFRPFKASIIIESFSAKKFQCPERIDACRRSRPSARPPVTRRKRNDRIGDI